MKYAVSPEGIGELKKMSAAIVSSAEAIKTLADALETVSEEHADTLGPHQSSIAGIVEEIRSAEEAATEPVNGLSDMLNDVAESYQEVIDHDRFSGGGN